MSISHSLLKTSQFYINVKGASVLPTTDSTGNYTLGLVGTGPSLVTNDATRGKVLSFPNTGGWSTNFNLPIIHTRLFWVKLNDTTSNNNTLSTTSRPFWFSNTNYMNFCMNYPAGAIYVDSTNTVVAGVWYFYALTYDGITVNLYRNGILDYSINTTSTATPDSLMIGNYSAPYYLNGYLDNIRCYNTALTQSQILSIYNYESNYPTLSYPETGSTLIPASIDLSSPLKSGLVWSSYSGYFADNVNYFLTAQPLNGINGVSTGTVTDLSNLTLSTGGNFLIDASDNFSIQWVGYYLAPQTGAYTWATASDDASYLWIGENAKDGFTTANATVNNGLAHAMQTRTGNRDLSAGVYYPIRIQYGEATGGNNIQTYFNLPGSIIPNYTGAGYYFNSGASSNTLSLVPGSIKFSFL